MAKPKLALIPAAQGTKLFSVLPSDGVGDFTFARGSVATRINAQGLIENVASGQSRLNYPMIDGVQKGCPHHILEPARTNVIQYSESFSNSYWTKLNSSITSNSVISPDGSLNASKLTEDTSVGEHSISASPLVGVSDLSTSIFVKYAGSEYIVLRSNSSGGAYLNCTFNLLTGVNTFNGFLFGFEITPMPNGWFRISGTNRSSASAFRINSFCLSPTNVTSNTTPSYTGDGTSGVYIYGAQIEAGSFPTSYIPNNGNAAGVTRSAETANGAGNASTFNDSEGVLMVESSLLDVSQDGNRISISDGSSAENRITFRYLNDNEIQIELGLTNGFSEILNLDNSENFNKIAVVYNSTNASVFINGFNLVTDTMSALSGLSQLQFNRFNANTENFYGNTKQIQYFDSALDSEQLEQLTSWTSFTDMANGQLYTIE